MTTPVPFFSNLAQCQMRVISPTDIVVTGQAQVLRLDSVAKTATALGSASLSGLTGALWAQDSNNVFITFGTSAQRWAGGPTWTNLNAGLNGTLVAISGTSTGRVFSTGSAVSGSVLVGTVLFWDGLGWTVEAIPAATPRLQGIWAAPLPGGQVFAVGINGTILTGP